MWCDEGSGYEWHRAVLLGLVAYSRPLACACSFSQRENCWQQARGPVMSKQKHRDRGGQGLTVKERAGRRAFRYRVPPEVADRVPSGTTVTIVSLSRAEIFALARRVEPEVTRWLTEKPAKNALEALLLMVQAIYALLQPPELPVPYKEQVEIAYTLAHGYDFAARWPYTRDQMTAAMTAGHPDLRPNI